MDLKTALLGGGIVTTGLMSGLLYGWSVSVIPGTKRVSAGNYVDTMQHINRAIINPAFVIPFMGIPLVLGGAAIMQFRAGDHRRGWLLAGATATYVGRGARCHDRPQRAPQRRPRRLRPPRLHERRRRASPYHLRAPVEPLAPPPHHRQRRLVRAGSGGSARGR